MGGRRRGVSWAAGLAVALGATCSPAAALGDYSYELHNFSAADNAQTGDDVSCDNGVAIAGGVSAVSDYAEGVYLNTSRPGTIGIPGSKEEWTVYVDNYLGGSPARNPRTYAVCDDNAKNSDYRYRTGQAPVSDGTENDAIAECRPGEVVVGGGASSTGFYEDETYLSTSAPWDSQDQNKRPDDGWQAELNNDETPGAQIEDVGVIAVCDRKHDPSDFRYVRKTRKVPDGTQKFRPAPCKPSETAVGGGVRSKSTYDHGLYINTTFPNVLQDHTLWQAAVDNYDTPDDEARKITTTAICR